MAFKRANNPRTSREKKGSSDKAAIPRTAFDDACRMLGRRRLTEAEVRERLARTHSQKQVEEAMAKLKEYRFVDDADLIADYSRSRLNLSPRSARMICAELSRRGIPEEEFERVFKQEFPDYDDLKTAMTALKMQFRSSGMKSLAALPPQKRRDKILRFLASRGFSYDTMMEAWGEFKEKFKTSEEEIYEGES